MTQIPPPPSYSGLPPTFPPDDLDIQKVSPEFKKEGNDWFAVFNPGVKRQLGDVSLVYTLMHPRYIFICPNSANGSFKHSLTYITPASYVASSSQRMGNTWLQVAIVQRKSTIRKLEQKSGMYYVIFMFYLPLGKISLVLSVLVHEEKSGKDMYIRSVSFSPDGKYLATGGDDKQIR
ncbi:hypothetical protein H0H93_010644, partial [Arthromyces matolae]